MNQRRHELPAAGRRPTIADQIGRGTAALRAIRRVEKVAGVPLREIVADLEKRGFIGWDGTGTQIADPEGMLGYLEELVAAERRARAEAAQPAGKVIP